MARAQILMRKKKLTYQKYQNRKKLTNSAAFGSCKYFKVLYRSQI